MYTHRTYREKSNDFENMAAFISFLNSIQIDDWLLGRLYAWRYSRWSEKAQDDLQFEKQAELFFDNSDNLCGIVITENFGYEYHLLSEKNEDIIFTMADFLTGGRNLCKDYSVILGKTDTVQQNVLTQKDFIYHEDADTTYVYTRNDIIFPQIVIPNGFTLTDQKNFTDAEAVDHQRYFSFNPDAIYDEVIDKAYKYSNKNQFLVPTLNIVLLNECGKPVSSCMGYWDRNNNIMEVEVVATLSAYENRGFAKMVISECIRRGISLGVEKVEISAWEDKTRHLYSSFGKPVAVQNIKCKK